MPSRRSKKRTTVRARLAAEKRKLFATTTTETPRQPDYREVLQEAERESLGADLVVALF